MTASRWKSSRKRQTKPCLFLRGVLFFHFLHPPCKFPPRGSHQVDVTSARLAPNEGFRAGCAPCPLLPVIFAFFFRPAESANVANERVPRASSRPSPLWPIFHDVLASPFILAEVRRFCVFAIQFSLANGIYHQSCFRVSYNPPPPPLPQIKQKNQ